MMAVAAAQKNREMFAIKKSYSIEVSFFVLNKLDKRVCNEFRTSTAHNQIFFPPIIFIEPINIMTEWYSIFSLYRFLLA